MAESGLDLRTFATSDLTPEIENDQVRRISGSRNRVLSKADLDQAFENLDKHFSFIGVSDEYDRSLVLLQRYFPSFDIRYVARNISRKQPLFAQDDHGEIVNSIKERNQLDAELYRFAKERLARCGRTWATAIF